MVLSSRDRRLVSVEIVWLGLSPERRRLRFSFQINDVKDRDRVSPAPLFSAGGRRRRLSSGRPLSCQSILSGFFAPPGKPGNLAQKSPRAAEGLPSFVRNDSIEGRNLTVEREEIKAFIQGPGSSRRRGGSEEERRI